MRQCVLSSLSSHLQTRAYTCECVCMRICVAVQKDTRKKEQRNTSMGVVASSPTTVEIESLPWQHLCLQSDHRAPIQPSALAHSTFGVTVAQGEEWVVERPKGWRFKSHFISC